VAAFIEDALHEFRRYKALADAAMTSLDDDDFFLRPAPQVNSVALIVKHLAGNFRSRWTDFLESDGEKPDRDRDMEFIIGADDSREKLLARWNEGWCELFSTVEALGTSDLTRTVTIRGEAQTVQQAMLRALAHVAYHVGQILYLARWTKPESRWLTIEPGKSSAARGEYRENVS
jgi:uncharacterized damage-inducible protein DinB